MIFAGDGALIQRPRLQTLEGERVQLRQWVLPIPFLHCSFCHHRGKAGRPKDGAQPTAERWVESDDPIHIDHGREAGLEEAGFVGRKTDGANRREVCPDEDLPTLRLEGAHETPDHLVTFRKMGQNSSRVDEIECLAFQRIRNDIVLA